MRQENERQENESQQRIDFCFAFSCPLLMTDATESRLSMARAQSRVRSRWL